MSEVKLKSAAVGIPLDLLVGWMRAAGGIPAEYAAELYLSLKTRVADALADSANPDTAVRS